MRHDLDQIDAQFVDSWLQGWNEHDLDQVFSRFADEVVFTSPWPHSYLRTATA